ncbi:MAG TPA: ABC transporter substrate-binding protein [Clostridia bacterium]|nr:ABC transporter substrate-binding protein [Clostridia bacterium]HUM61038.1 ABC transporter substrate-binding protein [Clostridia bacterium]
MKRFLSLALILALSFSVMLCAQAQSTPLVVTDTAGNQVTIEKTPEKVISLAASNTEILYALNAGAKVVGVDAYSDYPEEVLKNAQVVGDYNGPNVESILALDPDIVFAANYLQQDAMDALKNAGITVVSVEATRYQDIIPSIELVASVMGVPSDSVIQQMHEEEAQALTFADACKGKTVYYALSYGEWGDWTAGPGTFIQSMIEMLGAKNIADDMPVAWPMYSVEQLLEKDPEVILVSGGDAAAQAFCALSGYQELTAVKEGRVYGVDANTSSRPGPRITLALIDFARAISGTK